MSRKKRGEGRAYQALDTTCCNPGPLLDSCSSDPSTKMSPPHPSGPKHDSARRRAWLGFWVRNLMPPSFVVGLVMVDADPMQCGARWELRLPLHRAPQELQLVPREARLPPPRPGRIPQAVAAVRGERGRGAAPAGFKARISCLPQQREKQGSYDTAYASPVGADIRGRCNRVHGAFVTRSSRSENVSPSPAAHVVTARATLRCYRDGACTEGSRLFFTARLCSSVGNSFDGCCQPGFEAPVRDSITNNSDCDWRLHASLPSAQGSTECLLEDDGRHRCHSTRSRRACCSH